MPAVIKIVIFSTPTPLRKIDLGLVLINATIPRPEATIVNSAKNKPNNSGIGILDSLPHSKVNAR